MLSTIPDMFQSIVGKFLCCGRDSVAPSREGEKNDGDDKAAAKPPAGPSVKDSLLSIKYLSICVYCVILQTRMNSIPGWTYTWLQWSLGDPEIEGNEGNNLVLRINFYADLYKSHEHNVTPVNINHILNEDTSSVE